MNLQPAPENIQSRQAAYHSAVEAIKEELTVPNDGPVTPFVVMARAVRLARTGRYPNIQGVHDDVIANALFEVLGED